LSTLTLEYEKVNFKGDDELSENNELSRNNNLSKCVVDDFHYITPQDQDTYFFINDGDDV
jgi:hypothetical protein